MPGTAGQQCLKKAGHGVADGRATRRSCEDSGRSEACRVPHRWGVEGCPGLIIDSVAGQDKPDTESEAWTQSLGHGDGASLRAWLGQPNSVKDRQRSSAARASSRGSPVSIGYGRTPRDLAAACPRRLVRAVEAVKTRGGEAGTAVDRAREFSGLVNRHMPVGGRGCQLNAACMSS